MKIKRSLVVKLAAGLSIAAVLFFAVGTYALKKYLPPDKIRALMLEQALKNLNREVELGEISLTLLQGLKVENLRISELPDFKSGEFAALKSFKLKIKFAPLLSGRVVVDRVALEGLSLNVSRSTTGAFNFSDLLGSSDTVKSGAPTGALALPMALKVSKAALFDARFSYRDALSGDNFEVADVDAVIEDFDLKKPFFARAGFKVNGKASGRPMIASVDFLGKIALANFDLSRVALDMESFTGETAGITVKASGKVSNLDAPSASGKASFRHAGKEFFSVEVSSAAAAFGKVPTLYADFEAASPGFDAGILKDFLKDIPPITFPAIKGEARGSLSEDTAILKTLSIKTEFGTVAASGEMRRLGSPNPLGDFEAALDLKIPKIHTKDIPVKDLPSTTLPSAEIRGKVRIKGDTGFLEGLEVKTEYGSFKMTGAVRRVLSKDPQPDLRVEMSFKTPEIRSQDIPYPGIPPGLIIPAAAIAGEALVNRDLVLKNFEVKSKFGGGVLSGTVRKVMGPRPDMDLTAKLSLDLPEIKTQDLPIKGLPPLTLPAAKVGGSANYRDENITLKGITVGCKLGHVKLSGSVNKVLSPEPVPNLIVEGDLDLPSFKSADIPVEGMPADLSVPKTKIEFSLTGNMKSMDFKNLQIIMGNNNVSLSGKVMNLKGAMGPPLDHKKLVVDVLVKCRKFVLDEITAISPATREMELSGSGFFAAAVGGRLDKPVLSGKLRFMDIGMKILGLDLAGFGGDATFDKKRFDIPKLKGKVDGGNLAMDLTVEDFATHPKVNLEATLDRFDLGKFLNAKDGFMASRKDSAEPSPQSESPAAPIPAFDAKGKFEVGELIHPNAEGKKLFMRWDLSDITPDLKKIDGTSNLKILGGKFTDLLTLARREKMVKVLLLPVMIVQKVKLTPNLNNLVFTEIVGDYSFKMGVMTLHDSHVYNEMLQVRRDGSVDYEKKKYDLIINAKGTIDLPKEEVDLVVEGKLGAFGSVKKVSGPIENPKIGGYRGR